MHIIDVARPRPTTECRQTTRAMTKRQKEDQNAARMSVADKVSQSVTAAEESDDGKLKTK